MTTYSLRLALAAATTAVVMAVAAQASAEEKTHGRTDIPTITTAAVEGGNARGEHGTRAGDYGRTLGGGNQLAQVASTGSPFGFGGGELRVTIEEARGFGGGK